MLRATEHAPIFCASYESQNLDPCSRFASLRAVCAVKQRRCTPLDALRRDTEGLVVGLSEPLNA